ncbi:MAG: hypothetical protein SPJ12_08145, partial [Duodenibacillus sp.]|nr:hypothetical protein [Duodenibacillus sp.]
GNQEEKSYNGHYQRNCLAPVLCYLHGYPIAVFGAGGTKYVPLDRLCLSPQCGFSSTEEGNLLTEEEQWAKVRLVAEVAKEVGGE